MYLILEFFKQKGFRYIFLTVIFLLILFMGYNNLNKNNSRYDYQAYDYGNNILKTINKDSLYLCEGDYDILPYIQTIEKQRQDIKLVNVMYLPFKWELDNFIKKYSSISLEVNNPTQNLNNIITYYSKNNIDIFESTLSPDVDKLKLGYNFKQIGLLKKYLKNSTPLSSRIFESYSYNHGLYDKYIDYSARNSGLVMWYPFCMIQQGNDLLSEGNPIGALQLYKKAMFFLFKDVMKENEPIFYYNISVAYKDLNDTDNQIKYLRKAIGKKENFWQAYDTLGMVYFRDGILPMAKEMFEKALQYGDNNTALFQTYIDKIGEIDLNKQYEAIFNEATSMMTKGNYERAMDIYEFLMKKNYSTAIISKNIGAYYFQNNNLTEALKYFEKSKEMDKNAGIYVYIAYTYYKLGQSDKALNTLKEGMQTVGNDPQLVNLYNHIQQVGKIKNEDKK